MDNAVRCAAAATVIQVVVFCGYSGSGKTTLIEKLVGRLKAAGSRVSVIKHAHHGFDIDAEGKDSWRHRQAGAFEVLVASDTKFAKIRAFDQADIPTFEQLVAELAPCDWALVEGYKRAACAKLEVWRPATGHPLQYPDDPWIVAVCTDDMAALPADCPLPVIDLNDTQAVAAFLSAQAGQFAYAPR